MKLTELKQILGDHSLWLSGDGGKKADLRGANLGGADLHGADLRGADLHGVNFHEANLRGADLRGADLHGANLRGADLRGADLRGADLDYSSGIPLYCGGSQMIVDKKFICQILAHLVTCEVPDELSWWENLKAILMPAAIMSHRAEDLRVKTE